jgi:hypothetical protein
LVRTPVIAQRSIGFGEPMVQGRIAGLAGQRLRRESRGIARPAGIGREYSERLERQRMPGLLAQHDAIGALGLSQAACAMVLLAGRESGS